MSCTLSINYYCMCVLSYKHSSQSHEVHPFCIHRASLHSIWLPSMVVLKWWKYCWTMELTQTPPVRYEQSQYHIIIVRSLTAPLIIDLIWSEWIYPSHNCCQKWFNWDCSIAVRTISTTWCWCNNSRICKIVEVICYNSVTIIKS